MHPVSISVIGAGGTGSNVLACLVPLHLSLQALGHPGIFVYAYDPETVTATNVARQLFYHQDIGIPKANCIIDRINRSYGLDWLAIPEKYGKGKEHTANITISCVDSVSARKEIGKLINEPVSSELRDNTKPYYWLDIGNGKDFGQIILGTIFSCEHISKKYKSEQMLNDVVEQFPKMKDNKNNEPSCSLVESIAKQGLYTNKLMATYACDMLWKLFRQGRINYRGIYLNFDTLQTNPIPL